MQHNDFDLNILYQTYNLLVYNVALQYVQNVEDAEEITQDVFVKVHHSYKGFNQKSSHKTWIYRITVNQSLDFIKKKNSQKRFFIFGTRSNHEHEYLNASSFEHPGIALENKEESALLFKVINTLPTNQKTAFILSKIDGLSNPEVSEIMEMSISAVESLIFRAKNSLKEKLATLFTEYHTNKQ
ncbi:RNA polymerase sigma factor [Flavobacterium sp.]